LDTTCHVCSPHPHPLPYAGEGRYLNVVPPLLTRRGGLGGEVYKKFVYYLSCLFTPPPSPPLCRGGEIFKYCSPSPD